MSGIPPDEWDAIFDHALFGPPPEEAPVETKPAETKPAETKPADPARQPEARPAPPPPRAIPPPVPVAVRPARPVTRRVPSVSSLVAEEEVWLSQLKDKRPQPEVPTQWVAPTYTPAPGSAPEAPWRGRLVMLLAISGPMTAAFSLTVLLVQSVVLSNVERPRPVTAPLEQAARQESPAASERTPSPAVPPAVVAAPPPGVPAPPTVSTPPPAPASSTPSHSTSTGAPSPGPASNLPESLSKEDIIQGVAAHTDDVLACLTVHTPSRRSGSGRDRFVVRWRVLPDGSTTDVLLETRALQQTPFAQCIEQRVGSWTFPRHRVPGRVPIRFPFTY